MSAIDFHGAIATRFDSRYKRSVAFRERYRVWTALFERYVRPADHVMDLGCGSGVFSQYLTDRGCRVIGIDGSPEMIGLCRQKKTSANARYVVEVLPLVDPMAYEPQDVVLASSLLEYMGDAEQLLQQAWALLKPGGLLIVSIPNQRSVYRRMERLTFALTGRPRYFAHIRHTPTKAAFHRQLTSLEFQPLETAYFAGHDPVSRLLRRVLPESYVNNLLVGVYQKR